jgi:hypothetical protein
MSKDGPIYAMPKTRNWPAELGHHFWIPWYGNGRMVPTVFLETLGEEGALVFKSLETMNLLVVEPNTANAYERVSKGELSVIRRIPGSLEDPALITEGSENPQRIIEWLIWRRFVRGEIYTTVGNHTIAFNPYETVSDLYSSSKLSKLISHPDRSSQKTHLWDQVHDALGQLRRTGRRQVGPLLSSPLLYSLLLSFIRSFFLLLFLLLFPSFFIPCLLFWRYLCKCGHSKSDYIFEPQVLSIFAQSGFELNGYAVDSSRTSRCRRG